MARTRSRNTCAWGRSAYQLLHFALQGQDVHVQFPGPIVQGIPGESALHRPEARPQGFQGRGGTHTVSLAETQRQVFQPEMVIEMQIQERAVHVQEHALDDGQIRKLLRALLHGRYHILPHRNIRSGPRP